MSRCSICFLFFVFAILEESVSHFDGSAFFIRPWDVVDVFFVEIRGFDRIKPIYCIELS